MFLHHLLIPFLKRKENGSILISLRRKKKRKNLSNLKSKREEKGFDVI